MQIYHFENLTSTQDIAKQYLSEGQNLPFAIHTDKQSSGRGRSGNQWVSLEGNLLTSIAIPLQDVPVKDIGQYSFLTAVVLMDCLAEYGVVNAQNKWPNDILVDGQKIAGILLESNSNNDGVLNALIIGIGINIMNAPEGAICIHNLTGDSILPSEFLNQFIKQLDIQLLYFKQHGFDPIRKKWLDKAYGLGILIKVRLPNEIFHGEFMGLDNDGALLVKVDGIPRKVYSGDVFF